MFYNRIQQDMKKAVCAKRRQDWDLRREHPIFQGGIFNLKTDDVGSVQILQHTDMKDNPLKNTLTNPSSPIIHK